jgi:hypothetical protein
MPSRARLASFIVTLIVLTCCAQTTVTQATPYSTERAPRPARIIVYDFAGTPADIPPGSQAQQYALPSTPPTPDEIALGRQLGTKVAEELVNEIQAMGLPAVRALGQAPPAPGDLVIMGYFESVDPGSVTKRVALGFGAGAAELRTAVEGYLMTRQGLRRVGSGVVEDEGGKGPGIALPLAVAIASGNPIGLAVSTAAKIEGQASGRTTIEGSAKRTAQEIGEQLKIRFQRQGWI